MNWLSGYPTFRPVFRPTICPAIVKLGECQPWITIFLPYLGMNDKIMIEVRSTIEDIKKRTLGGKKILPKVDNYFDLPDLNVIWGLIAGTRKFL